MRYYSTRRYPGYSESHGGVCLSTEALRWSEWRGHLLGLEVRKALVERGEELRAAPLAAAGSFSTRILGKTMRDAVRNKERG